MRAEPWPPTPRGRTAQGCRPELGPSAGPPAGPGGPCPPDGGGIPAPHPLPPDWGVLAPPQDQGPVAVYTHVAQPPPYCQSCHPLPRSPWGSCPPPPPLPREGAPIPAPLSPTALYICPPGPCAIYLFVGNKERRSGLGLAPCCGGGIMGAGPGQLPAPEAHGSGLLFLPHPRGSWEWPGLLIISLVPFSACSDP